jgi:hypothetical protein
MRPRTRTFALAVHVITAVGWTGAVFVFLALGIVGLTSDLELTTRATYIVMQPAAWAVLVPLAFASLATGLVMSLGTQWGVFRHYWVLLKLLITVVATLILVVYMRTFREMAHVASDTAVSLELVRNPSPVLHASLALLALVAATALAVYKPFGLMVYGRSKYARPKPVIEASAASAVVTPVAVRTPRWVYLFAIVAVHVLLLFVILHLAGGKFPRH